MTPKTSRNLDSVGESDPSDSGGGASLLAIWYATTTAWLRRVNFRSFGMYEAGWARETTHPDRGIDGTRLDEERE